MFTSLICKSCNVTYIHISFVSIRESDFLCIGRKALARNNILINL